MVTSYGPTVRAFILLMVLRTYSITLVMVLRAN